MRKNHAVRKPIESKPKTICGRTFPTQRTYEVALTRRKKHITCSHCLRMLK